MAETKRARNARNKKRRPVNIERRLKKWIENNLEGDRWVKFSWNEIGEQARVSRKLAFRKVRPLVAEMTDRTLEEVQEIHRRQWQSSQATPFDVFCVQQLRQKDREKWTFKRIVSLVGFGYATVHKHAHASHIEMPPDTGGREVSDQLRQVLADELGIGINPDGSTHTLDQSLSADIEEPHETHQASLEASELGTTTPHESESASPANEELSEQDCAVVENSGAPHSPSTDKHDKLIRIIQLIDQVVSKYLVLVDENDDLIDPTLIYIVQQLYGKGCPVVAILRERRLNLRTKAQVYGCLSHEPMSLPEHIDLKYQPIIDQDLASRPSLQNPASYGDYDNGYNRLPVK